jgi:predicted phosphodiesterase
MRTREDIAAYRSAVPLALVSDIHGNDVALAAVVAELARLGIERVVCLGDVVQGGPQPAEVLDALAALGWPVVLGNSDDFLLRLPEQSEEPVTARQLEIRAWTLARLEPRHMGQMASWPTTLDLELEGGLDLRAFHGSASSYEHVVLPETPDWEAEQVLGGSGVDVLAGGHTHLQWARWIDGALYVNPGSVGAPYDRHQPADDFRFTPVAEYAVLTGGGVEFRRIPFDLEAFVDAGIAGGQPYAEEVQGRWRSAS